EGDEGLRQPLALAAVLARGEIIKALRETELQHEVAGGDHQPHLLVGAELGLREQAGEDERQREAEDGCATAAEHQGPSLAKDVSRFFHADSAAASVGASAWASKLVGRAPGTGFCTPSIPKLSSNWQAIKGFE